MDWELIIFLTLVLVFAGGAGLALGGAYWIVSHLVGYADESHALRLAVCAVNPQARRC